MKYLKYYIYYFMECINEHRTAYIPIIIFQRELCIDIVQYVSVE